MIENIEDIKVWQLARAFAQHVFVLCGNEPLSRDFGLKDQLNRSSGSIMDNIAEGYGRMGNKEFINFLTYAKGSCMESKSQLIRAFDRNYITQNQLNELLTEISTIINLIGGFISYLKKSDFKGLKFKEPPSEYFFDRSS